MSLSGLLRSRLRSFLWGALFLVLTNLAANAIPWPMKRAVDATGEADLDVVLSSALLLVGLAVVGALVRVLSRVLTFNGARLIEYDLRNRMFSHLTALPPLLVPRPGHR